MTEHITATERLRALLDERGVEWHDTKIGKGFITVFEHDGITWIATEHSSGRLSIKGCVKPTQGHYDGMTPEQAIAATLGLRNDSCNCTNGERTDERMKLDAVMLGVTDATAVRLDGAGTCHVMTIGEFNGEGTEYYDCCSNCGYEFDDDPLNYFPNCGRRIEVDDG